MGKFTVDFLCGIAGLSVEIDGFEFHNDRVSFTNDRRKSRIMQLKGYTHLQYSGSELTVNGGINRALDELWAVAMRKLNGKVGRNGGN